MQQAGLNDPNICSEKTSFLIEKLKEEIDLLQRLHILSQTESLILEDGRIEELENVVSQKGEAVRRLSILISSVSGALQSRAAVPSLDTYGERQTLTRLKTEGVRLSNLISMIDSNNRLRLEEFKNRVIQSSHQLQQELRMHRAYEAPSSIINDFFEVTD